MPRLFCRGSKLEDGQPLEKDNQEREEPYQRCFGAPKRKSRRGGCVVLKFKICT
jgi:hypothetical protein